MKIYKLFLIAVIAGTIPVCAQGEAQGLKDVYKDLFKIGNILNGTTSNNQSIKNLVLREFNSITPENELKPDATIVISGSTNENIKVQLNSGARRILQFCQDNKIGLRGHCLVWHAQTPTGFFRENFSSSGALVSKEIMDKRMESYIKNIFALIKNDFPNLNLYAYDVVNEAFEDNGTLRKAGTDQSNGQSPWTQIYGNDQFIVNAFRYARMYAPEGCKLFYNDYNEYMSGKRDAMYNLAMKLKAENIIDGLGMQAHLDIGYPSVNDFGTAVAKFASTGLEVQITEMDITISKTPTANDYINQGNKYRDIMKKILEKKESVTAFVVWGPQDDNSWRSSQFPVLFNAKGERKPAYDELYFLASGTYPGVVEPDANGYYFFNTFEDGTTQSWTSRGGTTVANTSNRAFEGTKSIFVSGRTQNWHGTARSLESRTFVSGNTYSFGAMAMYADGAAEGTFKLTLECNIDGKTDWLEVAQVSAVKGEWIELLNSNFTIPAGATNLLLYVEMPDLLANFYVDRAFGGIAGKTGSTSVPKIQSGNSLKAWTNGDILHITGIAEGKPWRVYTATGMLVHQGIAAGDLTTTTINIPSGVYIVWTEKETVKIIL